MAAFFNIPVGVEVELLNTCDGTYFVSLLASFLYGLVWFGLGRFVFVIVFSCFSLFYFLCCFTSTFFSSRVNFKLSDRFSDSVAFSLPLELNIN